MLKHVLTATLVAGALATASFSIAGAQPKPPTAAEWAKKPVVTGVSISPDGKHLAGVSSPDGEKTIISVWDMDNMSAPPKTIGAPPRSWFTSVSFLKNDRLLVSVVQPYEDGEDKRYIGRAMIVGLDGGNVMTTTGSRDQFSRESAGILDILPLDPKNILISMASNASSAGGSTYKLDVYSGSTQKVLQESDKFGDVQTDLSGDVRARSSVGFENGKVFIAQWLRNPETNTWEEHFRSYAKDREITEVIGFSPDKNIAYLRTSKGRDKAEIVEYDIKARKILGEAFAHKQFAALDVLQSHAPGEGYGEVLGFSYAGPSPQNYWLDPALKAAEDAARTALEYKTVKIDWTDIATGDKSRVSFADGADVRLIDWSDDRTRFVVVRSGPKVPTEYYLIANGKIKLLAKSRPWIDSAALGDMRLVEYPARDGLMIPAFLTTPPKAEFGEGPYPTIILPHGGPWARDQLAWDSSGWVQYFAARGYAVLQPQYRGSEGWGQKLWRAGDGEWGQKMQDDKDDGVKWLIEQKIAAPDRVAMHGFSYGGYAAMAASVRPEGLYQCAMAGAGVSDLALIKQGILTSSRWGREFQEPTIDGLSPIKNADKVSIPILLYHGDRDRTVLLTHSERFAAALKSAGKDVTFVKIPDLSHSSGDTPALQVKELTTLEDYLKTKCGPGGL